ncbi:MAG TPA: hypothetical protein IAA57_11940 [Candidatus Pullilachnospira intestinigallinarum]|nr:hypothetical protein [Candidatus Pullilachnospira intestinigallinarum]
MTKRENLLALLRREPFEEIPAEFNMCPSLVEEYRKRTGSSLDYHRYFGMPWENVEDIRLTYDPELYRKYYPEGLKEGTQIDIWGVAHEPGSQEARHMTRMRNPMAMMEALEELQEYPFPDFSLGDASHQKRQVEEIHAQGLAAVGNMQMTIWETAWYIRGMENLMVDMTCEPEMAAWVFDKVTEQAVIRARSFAQAGVDIVFLGDDIGMQNGPMMSMEMYRTWLKPRLARVIASVKEINPEILIFYHSCGDATSFIPELIDCGVDVLNPIQSECMDFAEIYKEYGGKISFHGTIGTQTTMPFGTPQEVKEAVWKNLDIASAHGGLFVAPTHLLEPEVPWENIVAYVEACREYKRK